MAIELLNWDQPASQACQGGILSIGNFDGVHRGHAALLAELRTQAANLGTPAVALTFDPHPLKLLRPEQFQPYLTTIQDRAELLLAQGVRHVLILRTDASLLKLSAREFFEQVIRTGLQARGLVEGKNFGFGRGREGNVETLAAFCRESGLTLTVVPPVELAGVRVSSSRVREALLRGEARAARELLGRPFHVHGVVSAGQHRGQTLGFPTANLDQIATLIPGDGVYAVQVHQAGSLWPGAANIGPNPTFGEQARKVEVHLIGFHGNLYGQELTVDFLEFLRPTRRFAGVSELIDQLRQDVERTRQIARVS